MLRTRELLHFAMEGVALLLQLSAIRVVDHRDAGHNYWAGLLDRFLLRRWKVQQLRGRQPQRFSQSADVEESDVPLSSLDTA